MSEVPFVVARNPYAVAEAVLGRPVDWSQIDDKPAFLEQTLGTPYEQLFDPRYDSPLYLGFALDGHGSVVPREPDLPQQEQPGGNDAERFPELNLSDVTRLGELRALLGDALDEIPVRRLAYSRAGGVQVELGQAPGLRRKAMSRILDRATLARLWDRGLFELGWTPPGGEWKDTGTFFKEAAEYFDPVQGALGDCYLVAAMSSAAWSLPFTFAQRSRATGAANEKFTNLIEFVDYSTGQKRSFEVTDEIVVYSGTNSPMYCQSSESGEIWPALIEKAYAQWRANTTVDHPDLTTLNGGDPVGASAQLTGRRPHYTSTQASTGSQLLNLVKTHSSNHRTVNPMTAWTYNSGTDSPDKVNYADANIVACHAYSVLGWITGAQLKLVDIDRRFGGGINLAQDYIVLRNPWGQTEATTGEYGGVVSMRDVSFWRTIDLTVSDGVFAITPSTFKKYFAGIGVAL